MSKEKSCHIFLKYIEKTIEQQKFYQYNEKR